MTIGPPFFMPAQHFFPGTFIPWIHAAEYQRKQAAATSQAAADQRKKFLLLQARG